MAILTILYFLCGITYVILGIITFLNDSKNELNKLFSVMVINLALWSFMFFLMNCSRNAKAASDFYLYSTFFWSVFYCIFLNFIIILTNKGAFFKKKFAYIILYLPAIISIYLYVFHAETSQNFFETNLGWAYITSKNKGVIWSNFFNIYWFSYIISVMFLLFKWWRNSKIVRERKQAKLILVTTFIAVVVGGITDSLIPMIRRPVMPCIGIIIIVIPVIGVWYSIKKYKLMDLNPENFALEVLKIMSEGLIIANHEGIIKDINKGALELLGYDKSMIINKPINYLFADKIELSKLTNCSSFEIEVLQSNNNKLPILLSSSVLTDEWGDSLGIVCIFQDISEIKLVQQKLKKSYAELEIKVGERTRELSSSNEELECEISSRIDMEFKIKKLAYYDFLTGLPNRTLFIDRLNQEIFNADLSKSFLGVLFLDLDSFKRINDTMGHAKGDEILKMVSKRLTNTMLESDTVCRVGGDEFLILIQDIKNDEEIKAVAEKILTDLKKPFIIDNTDLYITTSIGGSIYPIDGSDVETLIKNADIAMYKAKEKGRNKFELCTEIIKESLVEEMKLTKSLFGAIERNELELFYQPQISLITGKIIGLEALIRWNNTELGRVNPIDFIHIAEKTGLILPIGEWVLKTACRQNKEWKDKGILNVPIAVNISVNQFQNTKIIEDIITILKETGLDPNDLEIEITENIIMKETEYIIESLKQLKQLGVKIAIDDFGTEYSSLNYIKQLPVDKIKIDISFVRGININNKDEAIIKVIIALAKNLELRVIAEGVETREQIEFLKKEGCDEVQGYYYYKPIPAKQIEELMKKINK
ncbi:EAL domain-containing protein [Clostridium estertheticum]|uniref:EAL domain-containing protein n=1 Tax=Clostridium estertheticum TaxID=238834 RepID=UPI001C6DD4FB|nr:EAL domain-containing protein [Clostridium estertheticum]MBW9151529.1 EAL domain-containing protein [Clostridium estertheticum]WLC83339.1 EAL domain-containing protein [Clostridium estertheticum]